MYGQPLATQVRYTAREVEVLLGQQRFAYALFNDVGSAESAVEQLIEHGFSSESIGVLMRDPNGVSELPMRHKTGVGPGIVLGTLLGVAVGVSLPGLGLIAFGTLGAAAAGGATGTLAGIVGGMGLWKEEVDVPKAAFARGGVLIGTMLTSERLEKARTALHAAGAEKVEVATRAEAEEELFELAHAP